MSFGKHFEMTKLFPKRPFTLFYRMTREHPTSKRDPRGADAAD